jgi:hypothetical protein
MKLSEARVDLAGRLVAAGQITYESDPSGHFPHHRHSDVCMVPRASSIRLVGAKVRTDASGFLDVEEIPPVVFLPRSLSVIIQHALRRQHPNDGPVQATLASEEGWMDSTSTPAGSHSQPLSDWTLDITLEGEDLRIMISAALRAIKPLQEWQKNRGNYWPAAERHARVTVELHVNAASRVAMFGALLPELSDAEPSDAPAPRAIPSLSPKLADAPVSRSGSIFGYGRNGAWIGLYEGDDLCTLMLDPVEPPRRSVDGFLVEDAHHFSPRLWFCGWDVDRLIEVLWGNGESACIEFHDGYFGSLNWPGPGPNTSIAQGRIELRLIDRGLEFSYHVTVDIDDDEETGAAHQEVRSDVVTIPWEILILRYPRIGCLNPRAKRQHFRVV